MKHLTLINLYIYQVYFFTCYILALIFSGISFNLMFDFYKQANYLPTCGAAFMTLMFYLAAEAADLLDEIMEEKISQFKTEAKAEL